MFSSSCEFAASSMSRSVDGRTTSRLIDVSRGAHADRLPPRPSSGQPRVRLRISKNLRSSSALCHSGAGTLSSLVAIRSQSAWTYSIWSSTVRSSKPGGGFWMARSKISRLPRGTEIDVNYSCRSMTTVHAGLSLVAPSRGPASAERQYQPRARSARRLHAELGCYGFMHRLLTCGLRSHLLVPCWQRRAVAKSLRKFLPTDAVELVELHFEATTSMAECHPVMRRRTS